MTLGARLADRIRQSGPMPLSDYMSSCLLDPDDGYYTNRQALGAEGDFVTAPEISQMFGEFVGLVLAQAWLDQGAPDAFVLAELGPGRGTLLSDLWRATAAVPGFHQAAQVHLVEASTAMRNRQAEVLENLSPVWHAEVTDLPKGPLFLVANEFFDALPIRQFHRAEGNNWREVVVGLAPDDKLSLGLTAPGAVPVLEHRLEDTSPGDVVEVNAAAHSIATELGKRLTSTKQGLALVIDYGAWRSRGDTFQAVAGHAPVPVTTTPGTADLTAHVDFEALARASGAKIAGPIEQGIWLGRLGIAARAARLAQSLPEGPAREQHLAAYRRLTAADQMGTVFKVMGLLPDIAPMPAGFDP